MNAIWVSYIFDALLLKESIFSTRFKISLSGVDVLNLPIG
jgi:hypothetical protein